MSKVDDLFIEDNLNETRKLISEICNNSPMFDVVAKKVKNRYLEDQNGHWLADLRHNHIWG